MDSNDPLTKSQSFEAYHKRGLLEVAGELAATENVVRQTRAKISRSKAKAASLKREAEDRLSDPVGDGPEKVVGIGSAAARDTCVEGL